MARLFARIFGIFFRDLYNKKVDSGEWDPNIGCLGFIILFIVVNLIAAAIYQ